MDSYNFMDDKKILRIGVSTNETKYGGKGFIPFY